MFTVAFGESTMSRIQGKRKAEKISMSMVVRARQQPMMILDNRRITIRELADNVDMSFGSCQAIFTVVLAMKRAAAKVFPKFLNFNKNNVAWTSLSRC